MTESQKRRTVKRSAMATAIVILLLVTGYLASCPIVMEYTTHRISDPLRESILLRIYRPAISYAEGDLPGSRLYRMYFNRCRRQLAEWVD